MPVNSPFPGKQGICFTLNEEGKPGAWTENLPKVLDMNTYWTYSWGYSGFPELQEHGGSHLNWVPMSWGCPAKCTREEFEAMLIEKNVFKLIEDDKVNIFFGFNEPDVEEQSNMKVEQVLNLWPVLEKLNVPLVSPSCAHPNLEWMEQFMDGAKKAGYRVDYMGGHWYGPCNAEKFKKDLTKWHDKYKLPIILTEFAPADWEARDVTENKHQPCKILEFMKEVLPWLEETEWIVGYSWFSFKQTVAPGCSSALFDEDGKMTALGQFYKSVRSDKPKGNRMIQAKEGRFHISRGAIANSAETPIANSDESPTENPGNLIGRVQDKFEEIKEEHGGLFKQGMKLGNALKKHMKNDEL